MFETLLIVWYITGVVFAYCHVRSMVESIGRAYEYDDLWPEARFRWPTIALVLVTAFFGPFASLVLWWANR